jgi:hypothetical protein
LFQTAVRRGAVSEQVAALWKSNQGAGGTKTASLAPFFPRALEAAGTASAVGATPFVEDSAHARSPISVVAPLPPERPNATGASAAPKAQAPPLDLSRFMVWGRKT